MKRLFPFSPKEYLAVLACYISFFAAIYALSFLVSQQVSAAPFSVTKEAAAKYALSIIASLVGFVALAFLALTFLMSFAYAVISKRKFYLKLWPKFMLSSLLLALIFLIPWMFSLRLSQDQNPAATPVFIIFMLVTLHFANLTYFFTASGGKVIGGLRKGFWFGTYKIKKLILPYVYVLVVLILISLIMRLINFEFLSLVLSGIGLSWAALYVGRVVAKVRV